jgi:hypothetical protein
VNAFEGASLGFTAYNLPYGREGVRRAVDLQTPEPGTGIVWRFVFGVLLMLGSMILWESRARGAPWLVLMGGRVIIVLMFFGFARQAVSMYPAIFLAVAVGMDYLLSRIFPRGVFSTRWNRLVVLGAWVVLFLLEVGAARDANRFGAEGPLQRLEQYGQGAFTSHSTIRIRKNDGP